MTSARPTIKELARLSGVSVGTVSRALNGYTDVSAETRERVVRLARELDYTPAAAARTLVTERSHVIGLFLDTGEGHPDVQHPFFHEVLAGLKDMLGAAGFDLLLFASEQPGNGYGPHSYLKRARHHHVDGVVLMGTDAGDPEVERLLRSEVACVGVDMSIGGANNRSVMSDNVAGGALAVRHLAELGHTRIATITGLIETAPARDRLRGYREEIQRLGLAYRVVLMATREMGFVQARKYDLEVWAPGVERWLEVSSVSNFRDYQARRMAIRYRPEPGAKPELVHTLNGSGLAVGRT